MKIHTLKTNPEAYSAVRFLGKATADEIIVWAAKYGLLLAYAPAVELRDSDMENGRKLDERLYVVHVDARHKPVIPVGDWLVITEQKTISVLSNAEVNSYYQVVLGED